MQTVKFALLSLCLSGCCLFSPTFRTPDRPGETVEDIPAALDRFPYGDLSRAKAGQWVTYKERDGSTWTIKVVETDELVTVDITRGTLRLRQKIRPPDVVIESTLLKDKPYKQPIEQTPARTVPDREFDPPVVHDGEARISGKAIATRILTRSFADSEGLLHEETVEFSPQVPSIVTRTGDERLDLRIAGGIVRLGTEARSLELVDFGP